MIGDALHPVPSTIPQYDQVHAMRSTIVGENGLPLGGISMPVYDRIDATYPSTTQEVYTYKSGGSTVATITVNYTDITKELISSVIKS